MCLKSESAAAAVHHLVAAVVVHVVLRLVVVIPVGRTCCVCMSTVTPRMVSLIILTYSLPVVVCISRRCRQVACPDTSIPSAASGVTIRTIQRITVPSRNNVAASSNQGTWPGTGVEILVRRGSESTSRYHHPPRLVSISSYTVPSTT